MAEMRHMVKDTVFVRKCWIIVYGMSGRERGMFRIAKRKALRKCQFDPAGNKCTELSRGYKTFSDWNPTL